MTLVDRLLTAIDAKTAKARAATPGPWRWGDWSTTFGEYEACRRTLEHAPGRGPFPAIVNRDDHSRMVLPSLEDSIEIGGYGDEPLEANAEHIADNDPATVIRMCEAHRKIAELHVPAGRVSTGDDDNPTSWHDYCATCGSGEPHEYPTWWPCDTHSAPSPPPTASPRSSHDRTRLAPRTHTHLRPAHRRIRNRECHSHRGGTRFRKAHTMTEPTTPTTAIDHARHLLRQQQWLTLLQLVTEHRLTLHVYHLRYGLSVEVRDEHGAYHYAGFQALTLDDVIEPVLDQVTRKIAEYAAARS